MITSSPSPSSPSERGTPRGSPRHFFLVFPAKYACVDHWSARSARVRDQILRKPGQGRRHISTNRRCTKHKELQKNVCGLQRHPAPAPRTPCDQILRKNLVTRGPGYRSRMSVKLAHLLWLFLRPCALSVDRDVAPALAWVTFGLFWASS